MTPIEQVAQVIANNAYQCGGYKSYTSYAEFFADQEMHWLEAARAAYIASLKAIRPDPHRRVLTPGDINALIAEVSGD